MGRGMAIVAIAERNAESSCQARAMPGTIKDVSHTQVWEVSLKALLLGIRHRKMSRNMRMSQVDKDMQSCKTVEMMSRSEVVGRHETVKECRVLARQLSILGGCQDTMVLTRRGATQQQKAR
jgi:hypothetical protein